MRTHARHQGIPLRTVADDVIHGRIQLGAP